MSLTKVESKGLNSKLDAVDTEFKGFLDQLVFKKGQSHHKMKTFSPLDAVDFEHKGLHAVPEVGRDEMTSNDDAMKKLLANMLGQCKPGALSDEDLTQISGINGRDVQGGLSA